MTVLALPSRLTHDQAAQCAKSLGISIQSQGGKSVVLDASGLEKFDSSALAVLLQCRRESALAGKSLEIVGLPMQLGELARLYGVADLL